MKKSESSSTYSESGNRNREFTQIEIDDEGKVVVEFNVWDAALQKQVSTVLRLVPEEAKLLAEMLKHNADTSARNAAKPAHAATAG